MSIAIAAKVDVSNCERRIWKGPVLNAVRILGISAMWLSCILGCGMHRDADSDRLADLEFHDTVPRVGVGERDLFEMRLRNCSQQSWKLLKLSTGCACVQPADFQPVKVSAGYTAPIRFTVDGTGKAEGVESVDVLYEFEGGRKRLVRDAFKVDFYKVATINPQLIRLADLTRIDRRSYKGELDIRSASKAPFSGAVLKSELEGLSIQSSATPTIGTSNPGLMVGYLLDFEQYKGDSVDAPIEVELSLAGGEKKNLHIYVVGDIGTRVEARPGRLNLGVVRVGTKMEFDVELRLQSSDMSSPALSTDSITIVPTGPSWVDSEVTTDRIMDGAIHVKLTVQVVQAPLVAAGEDTLILSVSFPEEKCSVRVPFIFLSE